MPDDPPPEAQFSSRRAATRDRLMDAAVAVFAERGVNGASVEEISEAAGFTRGAFYSNFADKSALVLAMIERTVGTQYAEAERAITTMKDTPGQSPTELVGTALAAFVRSGRSPAEGILADRELLLHAARDPELRRPYLEFIDACAAQLSTLITDGLQHLGLEFSIPFEQAIELLTAVHSHQQLMAVFREQPPDTAPMRSLLLAITRAVGPTRS